MVREVLVYHFKKLYLISCVSHFVRSACLQIQEFSDLYNIGEHMIRDIYAKDSYVKRQVTLYSAKSFSSYCSNMAQKELICDHVIKYIYNISATLWKLSATDTAL